MLYLYSSLTLTIAVTTAMLLMARFSALTTAAVIFPATQRKQNNG